MLKYLILALCGLAGAIASLSFWVATPRLHEYASLRFTTPHIFNNPDSGIQHIRIAAFYFVPKNKAAAGTAEWRTLLEKNLEQLQKFHTLQFQGRSVVTYVVYPEPVVGYADQLVYDTESTQHGNPKALLNIGEELDQRVFFPEGDLYRPDFWKKEEGSYPVMFIMYEGVGASGGVIAESDFESVGDIAKELGLPESVIFKVNVKSAEGFFLLSRTFLSDLPYRAFGASVLAHEFYHTLGIPDEYEEEDEKPTSADIMGLGRFRPIEKTYIQRETLRALGL
ncbi:MAG: hypothetical protein Q7R73_03575 [bacterium]|nr:hypothetical protein [bacterium]